MSQVLPPASVFACNQSRSDLWEQDLHQLTKSTSVMPTLLETAISLLGLIQHFSLFAHSFGLAFSETNGGSSSNLEPLQYFSLMLKGALQHQAPPEMHPPNVPSTLPGSWRVPPNKNSHAWNNVISASDKGNSERQCRRYHHYHHMEGKTAQC